MRWLMRSTVWAGRSIVVAWGYGLGLMIEGDNRVQGSRFSISGWLRHSPFPDPREDPKSRSLNGGSYKVPFSSWGPKLGDLLSRSSRGSGFIQP